MPAKSLELKHNISMIRMMDDEIAEIEAEIKKIMDKLNPPLLTIPGIGLKMGAMILAEIGIFLLSAVPIKSRHMQAVLRPHISLDSLLLPMLKWKNVARSICGMLYSMLTRKLAAGTALSKHIFPRRKLKANIPLLQLFILPRN